MVVTSDVAERWLGYKSDRNITRMCNQGKLPGAYQPGGDKGTWFIPVEALEAIRPCPPALLSELSEMS